MRVCTTYGTPSQLREGSAMHEIRLDVFERIPEGIGENDLITLCGKDPAVIPKGFRGLVDTGEHEMDLPFRRIRSIHDFERTPHAREIVSMLSRGDQEISKGAFMASSFSDLHNIYAAAQSLDRRHVILGMGATGAVTRIRQKILKNEFTFGYADKPTAPGQFHSDEMESFGDDCTIVGITGNPLGHSLSPGMQNAAIKKAGLNAVYLTFQSPDLINMRDVLIEYRIRGLNVTIPYKQDVIVHLDKLSTRAEDIGAVNTVINDDGILKGENTDVDGIRYAFSSVCPDAKGLKVLIMGSGGAARAAAYTFMDMGCKVSVCGRNKDTVGKLCRELGPEIDDDPVQSYDVIVNCTPIGLVDGEYPVDINEMSDTAIVFDMVYGRETPLTACARSKGCRMADGKDMLVGQGMESFRLWFGKEPDASAMKGVL